MTQQAKIAMGTHPVVSLKETVYNCYPAIVRF